MTLTLIAWLGEGEGEGEGEDFFAGITWFSGRAEEFFKA